MRNLLNAASDITAMVYDGEDDVPTILDKSEKRIMEAASHQNTSDFTPIGDIVLSTIDKINTVYEAHGGLTGIPTDFTDLDNLTSGLQPSDLILVPWKCPKTSLCRECFAPKLVWTPRKPELVS